MSARPDQIAKLIRNLPPRAQPTSANILRYYGIRVDLVLGSPVTGLWCGTCLLPSRYVAPVYVLGADGPINIGTFTQCDGHQS